MQYSRRETVESLISLSFLEKSTLGQDSWNISFEDDFQNSVAEIQK